MKFINVDTAEIISSDEAESMAGWLDCDVCDVPELEFFEGSDHLAQVRSDMDHGICRR